MKQFFNQLIEAWEVDNIPRLSAALAYYTLFSLTPLFLICIALTGIFFGHEAAQGEIIDQIKGLVGTDAALQIQSMIEHASLPVTNILAQIIGVIILIIGASGMFTEMQSGLNTIWGIKKSSHRPWWSIIKKRLLSFTMILTISIILLMSLIFTVIVSVMSNYVGHFFNIGVFTILAAHSISFIIVTFLIAMIFKILPDAIILWKDVWLGAMITALMFNFGKYILSAYLSKAPIASAFGAAGSLIVLLVWVYYSAQIFFLGAVITKIVTFKKESRGST